MKQATTPICPAYCILTLFLMPIKILQPEAVEEYLCALDTLSIVLWRAGDARFVHTTSTPCGVLHG